MSTKPQINVGLATNRELWDFYNLHAKEKKAARFKDRPEAERAVKNLLAVLWADRSNLTQKEKTMNAIARALQPANPQMIRPQVSSSLKLDRTITCLDTKEVWANAHAMWKANPDWMTTAQQDRLTLQLYRAAKAGERAVVGVNGRDFMLVNVKEI